MMEVAKGLEESGAVFLWAIRPPLGFGVNDEFRAEWLPGRFEERVAERRQGTLLRGWAPQLEILRHASTGGFLIHCGWNSVFESLSSGLPMIGWPMGADQFCNSKMVVEEVGAGVELARGSLSRSGNRMPKCALWQPSLLPSPFFSLSLSLPIYPYFSLSRAPSSPLSSSPLNNNGYF